MGMIFLFLTGRSPFRFLPERDPVSTCDAPCALPGDSEIPEEIVSHPVLLTSQPPPLPFRQCEGIQTFMRFR
jgi:hypothetical protein